jgi:hypothetical protein
MNINFKNEYKNFYIHFYNKNMNKFPLDIELIIFKYLHELHTSEIKKEFLKNIKTSFIYKLKWKGNVNYLKEYQLVYEDKNLSLYFKNKLYIDLEDLD